MTAILLIAMAHADPPGPHCLERPPPDGIYRLEVADAPDESGTVAFVDGCLSTSNGIRIIDANTFSRTSSDGFRCASGTTVTYTTSPKGLTSQAESWSQCGGGRSEYGPTRTPSFAAHPAPNREDWIGLLKSDDPKHAGAAFERIASEQPAPWTCEPITAALEGDFGAPIGIRAVKTAISPCLAEALRARMLAADHLAGDALAPFIASAEQAERDLLGAVKAGNYSAVYPLGRRLRSFDVEPSDALRDALWVIAITPDDDRGKRQGATTALERLYRSPEDGKALYGAAVDAGAVCELGPYILNNHGISSYLDHVDIDALATQWAPLAACENMQYRLVRKLLPRLDQQPEAPDDAWALLLSLLPAGNMPHVHQFRDWTCESVPPSDWSPSRGRAMQILATRRCALD